jgi:hypothetical protein
LSICSNCIVSIIIVDSIDTNIGKIPCKALSLMLQYFLRK